MVKGDKRNKREFERKQRQEGGGSVKAGDGKSNEKKAGAVRNDRSPERGRRIIFGVSVSTEFTMT